MTNQISQPTFKSFLSVFRFFKYIWKPFFVSVALQIFLSYTILYSIEALNIAVSQVDPARETDKNSWFYRWLAGSAGEADRIILNCILVALGIVFIGMICDVIVAWTISWSFARLNKTLTPRIIRQLVFSETAETVKKQEATVVQRWLTIRQIADFFHNVLANSLGAIFTLGVLLWGTYNENMMAGHSLVVILLVWGVLLSAFSPKALKTSRHYAQMEENVGRNIRSSVSLSESLKSGDVFTRFIRKISPNITDYSKSISLQGFYGSLLYGVLSGIGSLAPLVVIIVAILSSADRRVGVATAATLYLFASKITSPLASLARVIPILQSQRVDFVRFQSIYEDKDDDGQIDGDKTVKSFDEIYTEGFTFNYDNLKGISFAGLNLRRGKITCLAGSSGAGKTTFLKILSGRLNKDISVTVNGSRQTYLNELTEEIAYLAQEPKLAEMTVRENLDLHVADGLIINHYCREAYKRITDRLPQNENTLITSDVIGLSVGQRRALAVINTLSLNKPIIILDEPFANVDNALADLLWNAILEEKQEKIILVALHGEKYKEQCDAVIHLN